MTSTTAPSAGTAVERSQVPPRRASRARASAVAYRRGTPSDAAALEALVRAHLDEGRLLPRTLDELRVHAPRFVVATQGGRLVGCGELAPLSPRVAEVRSLVVEERVRGLGIGGRIVAELQRRARRGSFELLCVFAHEPARFARLGFVEVPHQQLPEKIARDCLGCAKYQRCGQHALVLPLAAAASPRVDDIIPIAAVRA